MSPSGRTLNHYKTIFIDDELLCGFFVAMINLPIQYGFTLERLKTSVMPHLEKYQANCISPDSKLFICLKQTITSFSN
jgi:hypothetical protein